MDFTGILKSHRISRLSDRQRGLTLIEVLVGLAIAALVIAGISRMINTSLNDSRDQQVAQYQRQLATAVSESIKVNYEKLLTSIGTSSTAWSVTDLVNYNYIPKSYEVTSNAFGQSVCLLLQQPVPGQIDALLISTGGTAIPASELGYIAANSGVGGGSIGTDPPGTAVGAYGTWSTSLSSWNMPTCSGAAGHLANQLFMTGQDSQYTDFLYRDAVPGHPELNAMNVPIGLFKFDGGTTTGTTTGAGAGCSNPLETSVGLFGADMTDGRLVTCIANAWTPLSWFNTIQQAATLQGVAGHVSGETRVTLDTQLPYTWTGKTWVPLAVDDNGALNFPKTVAAGASCGLGLDGKLPPPPPDGSSAVAIPVQFGVASDGEVLSCQPGYDANNTPGNYWTSTASMVLDSAESYCEIIYAAASAPYDYKNCLSPNGANSWDTISGTMNNLVNRSITLKRNGLINVTSYAHMNYAQCGQTNWLGQLAQYLYIIDSTNTIRAQTQMQSPNILDASAGVTMSLSKPLPPGTYTITIQTNWGIFSGPAVGPPSTSWTSNYCPYGATKAPVINTPLMMGWNLDVVY